MAVGMSRNAEVVGKATDIDGKAWPGSKLAKQVSEVNEAKEMPDGCQLQVKQVKLYCKES